MGNLALFGFMSMEPAPADPYVPRTTPAAAATASTPSASSDPTPEAVEVTPVLAVYGDGYAAGNDMGGLGAAGWPALVAQRTGADLVLHAVPQAGYASIGITGQDYPAVITANPVPGAAVTILFGSRNDADEDLSVVRSNVEKAISAAEQASGKVVVIGPVWDDADVPGSALAVRDIVQAAAETAGVAFVDPLAEGWFAQETGLISDDGISPNDAGHTYLAERIAPVIQAMLSGER
jgi:lysophospholipase L1-like esterase